jgi:hypothetical protein
MTHNEILADFPELSADDLHEALEYGAAAVSERELPYRETAAGSSSTRTCRAGSPRCVVPPATRRVMSPHLTELRT